MALPPSLSEEERNRALALAKAARSRRAEVKRELQRGLLTFKSLLEISENDGAVAKLRVIDALESMPGYGKIRAQNLMEKAAISPTRRLQGLGRHQRDLLLKEFEIPENILRGRLLVLSGPGGVGKSTVAKALRQSPEFWVSVSATTRSPRFNEVDGEDYFFYSNENFDRAVADNEFLEWAEFAGNRYGTPAAPVDRALSEGRNVLLEIEIDGAKQVKSRMPEAQLVFLEPPSWEELVSRLEGRGTDSPERRAARLALAQEELAAAPLFDTVVVNREVGEVVSTLIRLATS